MPTESPEPQAKELQKCRSFSEFTLGPKAFTHDMNTHIHALCCMRFYVKIHMNTYSHTWSCPQSLKTLCHFLSLQSPAAQLRAAWHKHKRSHTNTHSANKHLHLKWQNSHYWRTRGKMWTWLCCRWRSLPQGWGSSEGTWSFHRNTDCEAQEMTELRLVVTVVSVSKASALWQFIQTHTVAPLSQSWVRAVCQS